MKQFYCKLHKVDAVNKDYIRRVGTNLDKKERKPVPNVSGTFQLSSDKQQKDLKDMEAGKELDEESLYYARLFMED